MPRKPVARSPHGRTLPQASQQKKQAPCKGKNIGPDHGSSVGVCRSHEQVFLRLPAPVGLANGPAGREMREVGGQAVGCPPTDKTLITARLPPPRC